MKTIPLPRGFEALVDDEDYTFLARFKWHYADGYAGTGIHIGGRTYLFKMHRIIMPCPNSAVEIDHIDRNRLNNQKHNLRYADDKGNGRNRGLRSSNKSGYQGVWWWKKKKRWRTCVAADNKRFISLHRGLREAVISYNENARRLHGEFAFQNPVPSE